MKISYVVNPLPGKTFRELNGGDVFWEDDGGLWVKTREETAVSLVDGEVKGFPPGETVFPDAEGYYTPGRKD